MCSALVPLDDYLSLIQKVTQIDQNCKRQRWQSEEQNPEKYLYSNDIRNDSQAFAAHGKNITIKRCLRGQKGRSYLFSPEDSGNNFCSFNVQKVVFCQYRAT